MCFIKHLGTTTATTLLIASSIHSVVVKITTYGDHRFNELLFVIGLISIQG